MGVVCCEAPPELAHDDIDKSGHHDPLSSSGTTTTEALAARLPSDSSDTSHATDFTSQVDQIKDTASLKTIQETNKSQVTKKGVRIKDEVTLIPLLTSASFFRKTKPTMITSYSHGIMPTCRIVTPASFDQDTDDNELVPKSSLWWTKEERREILQANQKSSRDFKRFQPTKMREANLVYSEIVTECCDRHNDFDHTIGHQDADEDIYDYFRRQHSSAASSTVSTATGRKKKRKRCEFSFMENSEIPPPEDTDLTIDLPTNVRGLEWGVMPDAKRYRKAHAKTVLKWQDRFRRMNERRRKQRKIEQWDSTESSSSSSSSSASSDEDENNPAICEKTTRDQQDFLAKKAVISSQRSCILARVFGKSDELAANTRVATASNLEERRSTFWSPTPSLTGTESSESENDDDDDDVEDSDSDDESESEPESDDESESDSDEEDQESQRSFRSVSYRRYPNGSVQHRMFRPPIMQRTFQSVSYTNYSSGNSQNRMFRPRMMPPTSWR